MEGLFGDEPAFIPDANSKQAGIKQPL